MHVKPPTERPDEAIAQLSRRQHGVVGRWQLLERGITREQIAVRLEARRLTAIHRGVYLVGTIAPAHAHEIAALLAFRLKAALSHRSATALWELLPYPATAPVWVTVSPARAAERPRIRAIRTQLARDDVTRRQGMWITTPARTILDMCALLNAEDLENLVAQAQFRRLVSEDKLRDQLTRNRRRRGVPALNALLTLPGGPQRTRSGGERAFLRLLRKHAITGYEVNVRVAGYEVDFLWREQRLAVEFDGWDGHSSRQAFERDRLKWAHLQAVGIGVMPVTGRQLRDDPEGVIARITSVLNAQASATRGQIRQGSRPGLHSSRVPPRPI